MIVFMIMDVGDTRDGAIFGFSFSVYNYKNYITRTIQRAVFVKGSYTRFEVDTTRLGKTHSSRGWR